MSDKRDTRYGHTSVGGGDQDRPERKDEGWESRQGGSQGREPGSRGEPRPAEDRGDGDGRGSQPPSGTNTQGQIAGIDEASRATRDELDSTWRQDDATATTPRDEGERSTGPRSEREAGAPPPGTDQPPRMGGPLGPDRTDPHLPEGAQDADTRGSGTGGFDVGVNAKVVGAVHQGVKEEQP